ncbi:hypothetical protein FRB95_005764 [Tulasnella sp. JGI-2019a]|nr:hypothetical protein FRB93_006155 [Tulasnella sp. JGI-2019a]KAG9029069.1 hypothetical protein FRB95_005764 [Tulasnella sp. JGI-2019a]
MAKRQTLYSEGAEVGTFIKTLFQRERANNILESKPNNLGGGGRTFSEAFKGAHVRFAHFARVVDDFGTSSKAVCGLSSVA